MASCPNCGRKLHLIDWRPECPGCHVNLNYFNSNERLLADSEKAEIEHAKFQPKVDRAKAAYAGSKLAIARIILSVLPIAGLFLPLTYSNGRSQNVLDIYKMISADGAGFVLSGILSGDLQWIGIAALFLSVVLILACLIAIVASLGPHGTVRSYVMYGLLLLCAGAAFVCFSIACGQFCIGSMVYCVLVLCLVALNALIQKKGISVSYTRCLIGGLPSEEYFSMVEQGLSLPEIRRHMLVALAELQEDEEAESKEEEAAKCPQ